MNHASDEIIDFLNSGNIFFTKINQCDEELPSFEKLYAHISLRTGDLESKRDLHLKGQVVITDNQKRGLREEREQHGHSAPTLPSNVLASVGELENRKLF